MPLREQGAIPNRHDPASDYRSRSKEVIPTLLEKLCSGSDARSEAALDDVRDLSAEQRFQITKDLFWRYDGQMMEKRALSYLWFMPVFGSCIISMMLMMIPFLGLPVIMTLWLGCGGYIWSQKRKSEKTRQNLETLLWETNDVRLLPIALTFPRSGKGQAIALEESVRVRSILLRRLLPLVSEEYTHYWTPEQTVMIMYLLRTPYRDGELTLALLHVAAFIGNFETLNMVSWLVHRTRPSLKDHTPIAVEQQTYEHYNDRIHAAALACQEKLTARLRPLEQAATLLRASASPDVPAQELLRAVEANSGITPEGELLRSYVPSTLGELENRYDYTPAQEPPVQHTQRGRA